MRWAVENTLPLAAIIYHLSCWAVVLQESTTRKVTGLFALHEAFRGYDYVVYFAVALLALIAICSKQTAIQLFLTIPQQIVLWITAAGEVAAICKGVFPDGHVPVPESHFGSILFLYIDQLQPVLISLGHTVWMMWKWKTLTEKTLNK